MVEASKVISWMHRSTWMHSKTASMVIMSMSKQEPSSQPLQWGHRAPQGYSTARCHIHHEVVFSATDSIKAYSSYLQRSCDKDRRKGMQGEWCDREEEVSHRAQGWFKSHKCTIHRSSHHLIMIWLREPNQQIRSFKDHHIPKRGSLTSKHFLLVVVYRHICVIHYAGQKILDVSVAQPKTCHHRSGECVGEALGHRDTPKFCVRVIFDIYL